jgi:hypothetical protein
LLQYEHDEGGSIVPLTIEVLDPEGDLLDKREVEIQIPDGARQGFVPCVFGIAFNKIGTYKFITQASAGAGNVTSLRVEQATDRQVTYSYPPTLAASG